MSYALSTPPVTKTGALREPLVRHVNVAFDVAIPEDAERFADLVVKAHELRCTARRFADRDLPAVRFPVLTAAAYVVPVVLGFASLLAGFGEGVAGAIALLGGVDAARPTRRGDQGLSAKAAEMIRDATLSAAVGLDATGVQTLHLAAIAALDEVREYRGLAPGAELVAQSLQFAKPLAGVTHDTARRAVVAAGALISTQHGRYPTKGSLAEVGTYEALALVARSSAFPAGGGYSNATLDELMNTAQRELTQAARATVQERLREPEPESDR